MSVLVVEDDPEIAEFLKEVLRETYAVESVGDVPAAVAHLERVRPDVVLLDCLLPEVASLMCSNEPERCRAVRLRCPAGGTSWMN